MEVHLRTRNQASASGSASLLLLETEVLLVGRTLASGASSSSLRRTMIFSLAMNMRSSGSVAGLSISAVHVPMPPFWRAKRVHALRVCASILSREVGVGAQGKRLEMNVAGQKYKRSELCATIRVGGPEARACTKRNAQECREVTKESCEIVQRWTDEPGKT